jgi:hypothetical protein
MSKKVKDLTLEEIKELCTEHYPVCKKNGKKCPMFKTTINCDQIMSIIRSALRHNHDALEEEIEISEPKVLYFGKLVFERIGTIAIAPRDEGDNND